MTGQLPSWIRVKPYQRSAYLKTLKVVRSDNLNTVCLEANCPNRYECFSMGTATFLILGSVCTRKCAYCNIKSGVPKMPDPKEPKKVARAVKKLGLRYAVVTSVTRDDLKDGGASQFAETIRSIRRAVPECRVEVLIPDFGGNKESLKIVTDENPDVLNHNIEVAEGLFPKMRAGGSFSTSIQLLKMAKELNPRARIKSGFMVGLGENKNDIIILMQKLRRAGCQMLTIGQYLMPNPKSAPVKKYYTPNEFKELKRIALSMGFESVASGPLVRSSYHAEVQNAE